MVDHSVIESAIFEQVERRGTVGFEELVLALPTYTWNQVFAVVDRLSREGRLALHHPDRFSYLISRAS